MEIRLLLVDFNFQVKGQPFLVEVEEDTTVFKLKEKIGLLQTHTLRNAAVDYSNLTILATKTKDVDIQDLISKPLSQILDSLEQFDIASRVMALGVSNSQVLLVRLPNPPELQQPRQSGMSHTSTAFLILFR
jgi:hypothetical protein